MSWKIVRDRTGEWAQSHGVSGQWRRCRNPVSSLRKKIFEEAGEYIEDLTPDELYDLRDVVERLIELTDPDYLAGARHVEKVSRLGMFSQLIEWNPVPADAEKEEL
jgi:predicted house-cleaning noncanonical NTP pyrophosphatase (MazG superfamily)